MVCNIMAILKKFFNNIVEQKLGFLFMAWNTVVDLLNFAEIVK